jgi:hypothetical protein
MRMRVAPIMLPALFLMACSPPVMFRVEVDEPIDGGTLTLNGNSAALIKNADGAYWAKWDGSDASGRIEIVYPDGTKAVCTVGYVTNGLLEIQNFVVTDRQCNAVVDQ